MKREPLIGASPAVTASIRNCRFKIPIFLTVTAEKCMFRRQNDAKGGVSAGNHSAPAKLDGILQEMSYILIFW
jgi:hypothetical protein